MNGPLAFMRFSRLHKTFLLVPKRMAWKIFGTSFSVIGIMLEPIPSPSFLCFIFFEPESPAASSSSEIPRAIATVSLLFRKVGFATYHQEWHRPFQQHQFGSCHREHRRSSAPRNNMAVRHGWRRAVQRRNRV